MRLATHILVFATVVGLSGCEDAKPFQLISRQYNLSASFPGEPAVSTSVNDEGLPKTTWTLKHDHVTWVEYYELSATCYNEILSPEKEFVGSDDDPVLALNGIKVVKSDRFTVQALETGRQLPAYSRISNATDGIMQGHRVILDGHCMIDVGARIDHNVGPSSLFMESVKILR